MGNQDVYQHPVVYQEVQRPEVYQPTSQKTYTVQAGVTYQVPTVGVERNGLTEYVPDPKQVPGLNYFPTHTVEQNGFAGYAASPSVGQEYASSYTTSTSDYTSEYILSSPECVPATPEFPPQPAVISAEVASVPPAQYVQYVPYYFYYPVGVPATTLNNSSGVPEVPAPRVRSQPVCVQSQTSSSSSASSDSYILRTERKGGGRRRRRKRGESEKVPMEAALGDVDSGYVNGEESSSEPGSEREGVDGHSEIIDSGLEVEQDITELMIDQVTNPTLVDVQFGEVAEILEQLRIEEEQGGLIEEVEVHHCEEIDQFDDCEEVEDGSEVVVTDLVSDPVLSERENEVEENQCTLMTSNADKGDIQGKSVEKGKKKKDKKKKNKKGKKASNVELVKEEKQISEAKEEEKTAVELVLVEEEPLVIDEEEESDKPLDIAVPTDTWTEVNISRKKKNHNNHVTFSQTVEALEPKEEKSPVEEISHSQAVLADKTEVKKAKTKARKVTKPLEEIKDLFFHEKPVEIVELARPERGEKVPKKRIRQKAKSKRAFLSEAKRASQTSSHQLRSPGGGPETSALPFLIFQPFGSFLQDQARSHEDRVEDDWRQMLAPPVGLCVQGTMARPTCPLEEQLVMQRAIPRRERVEVGPVPRPVVMIREQGRMGGVLGKRSNAGAQHVPGPRLQYSAGCRTGPLGVTRRVVPPFSLTQRLSVF